MRLTLFCLCLVFLLPLTSQEFPSVPEAMIPTDSMALVSGRRIFELHCSECHAFFERQTGPPLAYVYRFYGYDWLYGFITDSQRMVAAGDQWAVEVFNAYDRIVMPAHDLSKDEVWNILGYIKKLSETRSYNEYFEVGAPGTDRSGGWKPKLPGFMIILLAIILLTGFIRYVKYRKGNKGSS